MFVLCGKTKNSTKLFCFVFGNRPSVDDSNQTLELNKMGNILIEI